MSCERVTYSLVGGLLLLLVDRNIDVRALTLFKVGVVHRNCADNSRPLVFNQLDLLLIFGELRLRVLQECESSAQTSGSEVVHTSRKFIDKIVELGSAGAQWPGTVWKDADETVYDVKPVLVEEYAGEFLVLQLFEDHWDKFEFLQAWSIGLVTRNVICH